MTEETRYYGLAALKQVTSYFVKLFFVFILGHSLCHLLEAMCYTVTRLLKHLGNLYVSALRYMTCSLGHYPYLTVRSARR